MTQPQSDPASDEAAIRAWVTANLGGTITAFSRLPRWRPSWQVSVERGSEILQLHVRGDRPSGLGISPLHREYDVLRLLQENAIPVPHIYGWCPHPEAIVMAHVADTPFLGNAAGDPNVHRMVEDYAGHLAAIHALDITPFIAAGLPPFADAQAMALDYLHQAESHGDPADQPDALVRFVTGWLRRHVPMHRTRTVVLVGDAPQFFHDGTRVTALYDLELAKLGDPIADLASIRVRDINEPIGDVASVLARYGAQSGDAIDWPVLSYYTVLLFIAVPMMTKASFRTVSPHPAFVEYLSWGMGASRAALEAMAEALGLALDPAPTVPVTTPRARYAWRDLIAQCSAHPVDGFFRQPPALSLAFYLQRLTESGDAIDRAEIADAQALLGLADTVTATLEARLDAFVEQAGPDQDAALVRYFHRRQLRRLQLLRDYPGPIVTRGLAPIDHRFPDAYPRPARA